MGTGEHRECMMNTNQNKPYEQPAMDVVELETRVPLLAESEIVVDGIVAPWGDGDGDSGDMEM